MKKQAVQSVKMADLADRLEVGRWGAVGVLQMLWCWASDQAPDGVVSCSPRVLARLLDFEGDGAVLVDALVGSRWLDARQEGGWLIHDWPEHCEDAVHMALARAGRRFGDGTIPRMNRLSAAEREAAEARFAAQDALADAVDVQDGARCAHGVRTVCAPTDNLKPITDRRSVKKTPTDGHNHDRSPEKPIGAAVASVGRSVGVSAKLGAGGGVEAVGEVLGRMAGNQAAPVGRRAVAGRSGGGSGVEAGGRGSGIVGAVSGVEREQGTKAERVDRLARQIVAVTGEPESYVEWWGKVVAQCLRPGYGALSEVLTSKVQEGIEIRKGRAKLKDIPAMRNPGAVIAGAVRDAAQELGLEFRLPPKPAVRAARPGARGVV